MAEVLKQALASLCSRSGWCYAVFWKLKRRSRMVLTWEDGYYEFAPVHQMNPNSLLTGSGRNFLGAFKQDGTLEDQIQLAVAKMSFHVYSLGEGIIGRVAFTGKHQWIFATGERISESGPGVSEKYPDGWSNQFAAGIKTIAVVAVQQGVVQLGSTQMMTEDLNLVGQIRALFGTLQSVPGAFVSEFVPEVQLGRGFPKSPAPGSRATAPATPTPGRTSRSLRALEVEQPVKPPEPPASYTTQNSWASPNLITFPEPAPRASYDLQSLLFQGESSGAFGAQTGYTQSENFAKRGKFSCEGLMPKPQNTQLLDVSSSFGFKLPTENTSSRQFDTSTNIWSPSATIQSSAFSLADMEPFVEENQVTQQIPVEDGFDYSSLFKAFQKDDLDDFNNLLASLTRECAGPGSGSSSTSHFSVGDELSEALVPPLLKNDNMFGAPQPEELKSRKQLPSFELPLAPVEKAPSSFGDIFSSLSDSKPEQLLDAIVAGASSLPPVQQLKTSSSVSVEAPRPAAAPVPASSAPAAIGNPSPGSQKQPVPGFDRDLWAPSSVSLEVSSSSWTDRKSEDRSSLKESGSRKGDEPGRVNGRKRLRPGEAPRPRPKDRQQIQDRVRELRDIVPNATKCSIDALLEKTIRHMKFLQSVTQHGDKWKTGGADMSKSLDTGLETGASWALEYDGKGSGVPILVENLKQPRQMLVEMLCEERGLFWEIAENIRGLGLTILKGVMESRNEKVWARFNVEGTKEVNRVKVLWNLTQLLKVNPKGAAGASSYSASEVTEMCSESHGTPRFQPPVASHAIAVSPGWT